MGICSSVRGEKQSDHREINRVREWRDEHLPARRRWHNVRRNLAISPRAGGRHGRRHLGGFLPSERNYGIAEESGGCDKDDGLGHQPRLGPSLDLLAAPEFISRFIIPRSTQPFSTKVTCAIRLRTMEQSGSPRRCRHAQSYQRLRRTGPVEPYAKAAITVRRMPIWI